jgi:hypothetical protein
MLKNRSFQVKLVRDQKKDETVTVDEAFANITQAQAYAAITRGFVDKTIDNASSAIAALMITQAACSIAVVIVKRILR